MNSFDMNLQTEDQIHEYDSWLEQREVEAIESMDCDMEEWEEEELDWEDVPW